MSAAKRVGARRATARHRAAWIITPLSALVLLPSIARSTCETVYCQYAGSLDARRLEAEHRAKLASDPADLATWQALLEDFVGKSERERWIARYLAHFDWEPQPALEIDLEARLREERSAWIADWKLALPDRGEPWCAEAELEESPAARVDLLRIAAARLPNDAALCSCLARALDAAGLADEAVRVLEDFLAEHPDDDTVHTDLTYQLRGPDGSPEKLRAALEERARRFPKDPWARQELLQFYDANSGDQRDQLLAQIAANGDFDARLSACGVLSIGDRGTGSPGAHALCLLRLLADFSADELGEDDRVRLGAARHELLIAAIWARDWPTIHGQLASWPAESLAEAWSRVTDLRSSEGCRAFGAAWSEGALRPALVGPRAASNAGSLAWGFRRCGEVALADEVERPFVAGASDEDLASMGSAAALAETRRRAQSAPEDPRRWRELDSEDRDRPLAERLPGLLAWHDAGPSDSEPALRLSRAYAALGNGEEAVRWLVEAAARHPRRGEDMLLEAAALALRFRLDDTAATTARKVLAASASPRQHAEAHYVLGRVALRQERREEAATELLRYFPLRLRYAGDCGASADRGLLMLLLANYDLPRLRGYLAERDAALAWFREHLHNPPPAPASDRSSLSLLPDAPRHYEPLSCLAQPLPPAVEPEVIHGCVPPGTLEYLAQSRVGAAPADERTRRRREAKAGVACPPRWQTDLDLLFEDERLLSFAAPLTMGG